MNYSDYQIKYNPHDTSPNMGKVTFTDNEGEQNCSLQVGELFNVHLSQTNIRIKPLIVEIEGLLELVGPAVPKGQYVYTTMPYYLEVFIGRNPEVYDNFYNSCVYAS